MGFKALQILFLLIIMNFMIVPSSQKCLRALRSSGIDCWSSCDLGNCAHVEFDPRSYVRCSWQWNRKGINKKINTTTTIYYSPYDGKSDASCKPSSHECNSTTGHCVDTFFLENCTEIADRLLQRVTAWFTSEEICQGLVDFSVCSYAKPQPPIITKISFDEDRQHLLIETSRDTCPSFSLTFNLKYSWTRGNEIHEVTDDIEPRMIYKEAALYKFALRLTKGKFVFSDPAHGTYVTKPLTALERGRDVRLTCLDSMKENKNVTISWEKHGIIDYFNVTIVRTEDNSTVHTAIVNSTFQSSSRYSSTANVPDPLKKYSLFITAFNEGGSSTTFRKDFGTITCEEPPKIHCNVVSKGESWIQVGWKIERSESYPLEIDFVHPHKPDTNIAKGRVDSSETSRNGTGLEQCVPYNIFICADAVVCCELREFTRGPGPQAAPDMKTAAVTSRNLTVSIQNTQMNDSLACGKINRILVTLTSEKGDKYIRKAIYIANKDQQLSLRNLEPNTEYQISVASVLDNGIRGLNETTMIKTLEEAPDDSPTIYRALKNPWGVLYVEWNAFKSTKGEITYYNVRVKARDGATSDNLPANNCTLRKEEYFCTLLPKNNSAFIKVNGAEQVSMQACIGDPLMSAPFADNEMCSPWSEAKTVLEDGPQVSSLLIILCVICGVMLLLVIGIGTIYRLKTQGPKATKPTINPVIQAEFKEGLLTWKDGNEFEKKK